jgi:hypothetical protein
MYKYITDTGFYITSKSSALKIEQIECSETSANINHTPGKHPKVSTLDNVICFNKLPTSEIIGQEPQRSLAMWQNQWNISTVGQVTKGYFLDITERLTKKINLIPNLTAMLTAHGKTVLR